MIVDRRPCPSSLTAEGGHSTSDDAIHVAGLACGPPSHAEPANHPWHGGLVRPVREWALTAGHAQHPDAVLRKASTLTAATARTGPELYHPQPNGHLPARPPHTVAVVPDEWTYREYSRLPAGPGAAWGVGYLRARRGAQCLVSYPLSLSRSGQRQ